MVYRRGDPQDGLILRLPRAVDDTAARQARQQGLNFGRWVTDGQSWGDYLVRLAKDRDGVDLSPGMAGSTLMYADIGGRIDAILKQSIRDGALAELFVQLGHDRSEVVALRRLQYRHRLFQLIPTHHPRAFIKHGSHRENPAFATVRQPSPEPRATLTWDELTSSRSKRSNAAEVALEMPWIDTTGFRLLPARTR